MKQELSSILDSVLKAYLDSGKLDNKDLEKELKYKLNDCAKVIESELDKYKFPNSFMRR